MHLATQQYQAEAGTVFETWSAQGINVVYRPDNIQAPVQSRKFTFAGKWKPEEVTDMAESTANAEPQGGNPTAFRIARSIHKAVKHMAMAAEDPQP